MNKMVQRAEYWMGKEKVPQIDEAKTKDKRYAYGPDKWNIKNIDKATFKCPQCKWTGKIKGMGINKLDQYFCPDCGRDFADDKEGLVDMLN